MSEAEYNAIQSKPLSQLTTLGIWQLQRYVDQSSPAQKKMLLEALKPA